MKIASAEYVQSKPYPVSTLVSANPTGDYKYRWLQIRAEDVLEMFNNCTWQS